MRIKTTIFAVYFLLISTLVFSQSSQQKEKYMKIELKPLPYATNALEPYLDAETVSLHHDKHQATYVNNLNATLEKIPNLKFEGNLCKLLKNLDTIPEEFRTAVRNNGGGVFNHEFYWGGLTGDKTKPSPELASAIEKAFGSMENFQKEITQKALAIFGSGYLWLCVNKKGEVMLISAANQDNPFSVPCKCGCDVIPIFCIDVWEHSYYLKYRNLRAEYLKNLWSIINWDKISDRYESALKDWKVLI